MRPPTPAIDRATDPKAEILSSRGVVAAVRHLGDEKSFPTLTAFRR
jgi:hypothetical protein